MYRKIISNSLSYTRPIIIGKKYYETEGIINDIKTCIVLNKNGDLLTTKDIAENFILSNETNEVFKDIFNEMKQKNKKKIEKKYGITKESIISSNIQIIDVAEKINNLEIIFHKYLNLAIIKCNNENLFIKNFPKFYKGNFYQGQSVVGIGFPFPEYDTFKYDNSNNTIIITGQNMNFPSFPITGILTRNILDEKQNLSQFEINHEIYPGMNGGPIVDMNNNIIGIMSSNKTIMQNNNPIAKLGIIINSNEIIDFLKENNIEYGEINE